MPTKPKPPGRTALLYFGLSRDGDRTRDLGRDGRGSAGRTDDAVKVRFGKRPSACIVATLEFCFRLPSDSDVCAAQAYFGGIGHGGESGVVRHRRNRAFFSGCL